MKRLRKIIARAGEMCRPAYAVFMLSIVLSIMCSFAALVMLISAGDVTIHNYWLISAAGRVMETPPALLIVGAVGSVCIEDRLT